MDLRSNTVTASDCASTIPLVGGSRAGGALRCHYMPKSVASDDKRRYHRAPKYRPVAVDRFPSEREMLESIERHWGNAPQNVQCNPSLYATRPHRVSVGARVD